MHNDNTSCSTKDVKYLLGQLVYQDAVNDKSSYLDDNQHSQHSDGKVAELSDGAFGSWSV